jgi:hypothetical protein
LDGFSAQLLLKVYIDLELESRTAMALDVGDDPDRPLLAVGNEVRAL